MWVSLNASWYTLIWFCPLKKKENFRVGWYYKASWFGVKFESGMILDSKLIQGSRVQSLQAIRITTDDFVIGAIVLHTFIHIQRHVTCKYC